MAWYFFWQQVSGNNTWKLALAEQRAQVIKEHQPEFTTILDLDHNYVVPPTKEESDKIHYRGPLYFDFDSGDIGEAIKQFHEFLDKLEKDHKFDLKQAELYASGGKGFHVIIPSECFVPKQNPRGTMGLPRIYKEMANALYVDCLDIRVYTAKHGRQFRTANIIRSTASVYKVSLSLEEARSITPETYAKLCSAPKAHVHAETPELNTGLSILYVTAADKIAGAIKNQKKFKVDLNLIKKFKDKFPESIAKIMSGDVQSVQGFHRTAIQLAVTAHALGKSEKELIELCKGLIEKHKGDGDRYKSKSERIRELERAYSYHQDDPSFEFSVGAIKSLFPKDAQPTDLGGRSEEEASAEDIPTSITNGIVIEDDGIYRWVEGNKLKISDLGISNPRKLIDVNTHDAIGYEVDIELHGEKKPSRVLQMGSFLSRGKFMQFTLAAGGVSVNGSDMQLAAISDILNSRAVKSGNQVFTIGKEGIDIIPLPDGQMDVVWADKQGVESKLGLNYRLSGAFHSGSSYDSDLRSAPQLDDTKASREFFRCLFRINKTEVIARMLGWSLACFYNQPIRHIFDQFPLVQVYGTAGAGKTSTNKLLAYLHYYKNKPMIQNVSDATPFVLEALASGSGSVPMMMDEFKPREMSKAKKDRITTLIKGNYNGLDIRKGHLGSETGQSELNIRKAKNTAPMILLGEAMEDQTAVVHRCVMVSFNLDGKRGHIGDYNHCMANKVFLSSLGKECGDRALRLNMDALEREIRGYQEVVDLAVGDAVAEDANRSTFNIAVVLTGLEFGRRVMKEIFTDGEFDVSFTAMKESILAKAGDMVPKVLSEISKVIDTLAYMSRSETDEKTKLELGKDYMIDGGNVELNLRSCHTKYARFKRSIGEEVLFNNMGAFVTAMNNYGGVKDRVCMDSTLKDSPTTLVHAIPLEYLTDEGIAEFYCS